MVVPDDSDLLAALLEVRLAATTQEERLRDELDELPPTTRGSAANLVHYIALRQFDIRDEQRALAQRGLSSLGRAEAHILATLDATIGRLAVDVADVDLPDDLGARGPSAVEGRELLFRHTVDALGPAVGEHDTRIMVTLPTEAASDPGLVQRIVDAGMSVARINSAHDGPDEWRAMAANVRRAAARAGRIVRIAVDLPGPKLRTGTLPPGPEVRRARPRRDDLGRTVEPVRVRFVIAPTPAEMPDAGRGETVVLPVGADFVDAVRVGDEIRLVDARGRRRRLNVVRVDDGVTATTERTTYFTTGLRLAVRRKGERVTTTRLGTLPALPASIGLRAGDRLELRHGDAEGRGAVREPDGSVLEPAFVSVELDEVFGAVEAGQRVLIDDGAIETVVREVLPDRLVLDVTAPASAKLRAEKGINLPDTDLSVAALTEDDLAALEVMAREVDLVALSYVGGPDDVARLHDELDRLGAHEVGVILKIEHASAFQALPGLLLRALRRPPAAVMVARGDLAVEVGFERLAELQEEILWFGEAAHVPVIWATQVLESLAKHGAPTRAEVTDVVNASRAECVMLNKGPFIPEAIRFLDDVLTRMEGHQEKRTPMLRRLSVADAFTRTFGAVGSRSHDGRSLKVDSRRS